MNTNPEPNQITGFTTHETPKLNPNIIKPIVAGLSLVLMVTAGFGIYRQYNQLAQSDSSDASTGDVPASYPVTYPTLGFYNLQSELTLTSSKFSFEYSGTTEKYSVFVQFCSFKTPLASGAPECTGSSLIGTTTQSPLIVTNLAQNYSTTYFCGAKIRWQVANQGWSVTSDFKEDTVKCTPSASPSIRPSLIPSPSASPSASLRPSPTASASATLRPSPSPTPAPWQRTYQVENGTITGPFRKATDGRRTVIYQDRSIFEPYTQNGLDKIAINVPYTGVYFLEGTVRARNTGENSFLVNVDANPVSINNVWDIEPAYDYKLRTVTWRGTGGAESNYRTPQGFFMTAGNHTIYLKGREKNTRIDNMIVRFVK